MPLWTSFEPGGEIRAVLAGNGESLSHIWLLDGSCTPDDWVRAHPDAAAWERRPQSPVLEEAARQLTEYLQGCRREFALPLNPAGTAFQQQVWSALSTIPYGETRSYAWLAARVGRPAAIRAVGAANGRNPLPIVIPCHRVIGADGSLRGYGGGLGIKRYLLQLESPARTI